METWFTLPDLKTLSQSPPPRWKMAIVIFFAAYAISSLSRYILTPFIAQWPILGNAVIYTAILVIVSLTYFAVPITTNQQLLHNGKSLTEEVFSNVGNSAQIAPSTTIAPLKSDLINFAETLSQILQDYIRLKLLEGATISTVSKAASAPTPSVTATAAIRASSKKK